MKENIYRIPDEFFFRLHHVRPRFKNDVEEVLLYVATSISEMPLLTEKIFNNELNRVLFSFKKNSSSTQKTIDNWRTEISALFGFIQEDKGHLFPGVTSKRLANNQYLDEFFNYFLYSFQYPGGHIKPQNIIKQIEAGVKFKPCNFILQLLIEGEKITGKPFSITAEELTQCAYFDLRVTTGKRTAEEVAHLILFNRSTRVEYDHKYKQLWNEKTESFPSSGDVYRYAGDILDYMTLANLVNHKGTGYYYYLNSDNKSTINFHLENTTWFNGYDQFYGSERILNHEISNIEELWFNYVNSFDNIEAFTPHLDDKEVESISILIQEYYSQIKDNKKFPTKVFGDYGETLILAHEYLRTKHKSKRQHLINKIPTALGVGYDLQSIEIEKNKRYIEVKTTKSKKAINNNRFKLTHNEWDTAETLRECYFIYCLVINDEGKNIFIIKNPVKQYELGNIKVDKNLVVEFTKSSGEWHKLMEIVH
ncbi:protein NO VEIN domain-containing protein [Sphingobacterium faecium]|uniref:protein NO VEIN domain-containing protein n=1 Tax=Sphingobacterium faecium TaxID=34087 RepID=UPI00320ACA32